MSRAALRRFANDERGSFGIEYAVAIPVLVTMMIGIMQFAAVLHTSGVMRHALGEGLRLAKVDPTATTEEVIAETRGSMKGVDLNKMTTLNFERDQVNATRMGRMTMTYDLQPIIPFAEIPPITLTETRQVYLPS